MSSAVIKRTVFKIIILMIFTVAGRCDLMIKKEQPVKKDYQYDNAYFESLDRGKSNPEEDRTVYYKIYLDKELTAKTTSGLFYQRKKLRLHLASGRYLFFAERWYLEESGDGDVPEYKRANNVWQMKPIYIDIPDSPSNFKMVFGIDHDIKEFYYLIEGLEREILDTGETKEKIQE